MSRFHDITLYRINEEGIGAVIAQCLEPEYYNTDMHRWSHSFENLIKPYLVGTTNTTDETARQFCRRYLAYKQNIAEHIIHIRKFLVRLSEYSLPPPKNLASVMSKKYAYLTNLMRQIPALRNISIDVLVADLGEHEALRVSTLRFIDDVKRYNDTNERLEPDIYGVCMYISILIEELNDLNFFSHLEKKNAQMNQNHYKILFLAASPRNEVRIRVDQEARDIRNKLQMARKRDAFDFVTREAVRAGDITQAMLDQKPYVVHFSGHGTVNGEICVEKNNGNVTPMGNNALGNLFKLASRTTKCVILNACYSEGQATIISQHIDFVIGMKDAIDDDAAISFSVGFYMALGAGKSIEIAYEYGCTQIGLENQDHGNLIPILLRRQK